MAKSTTSATVFAVESADRFSLLLPPKAGSAPEFKAVVLSHVTVPRGARRATPSSEATNSDPCGAEAYEFVRAAIIGKPVTFVDHYSVDALQRVAGGITLASGEDLAELLLKAGLASVPERASPKIDKALHERYAEAQRAAKAARVGQWASDAKTKIATPAALASTEEVGPLAAKLLGQTIKVRIDRVLHAASYFVTVVAATGAAAPSVGVHVPLALTGVTALSVNMRDATGAVDPVALESKFHVERLLTHRHVNVTIEGSDAYGLLGSITGPKGAFQEEILAKGFARVSSATIARAGDKAAAFLAAEAGAKEKLLGLWRGEAAKAAAAEAGRTVVAPGAAAGAGPAAGAAAGPAGAYAGPKPAPEYRGTKEFTGTVVQILSGDTIVVRNSANPRDYVKVSLAGVRAPRTINRDTGNGQAGAGAGGARSAETRSSYEEYTWEAREYLRTNFIGKEVSVSVEQGRSIGEQGEVRAVGTVVDIAARKNLGAQLVLEGLGTFFLGRSDTCSTADVLVAAQEVAVSRRVNIHSTKPAPSTKITELNRIGEAKGKYYLSFFQRGMHGGKPPVWRATVDLVLSGSTFRVYIPKEQVQFTLKLAGVIAPATGSGADAADPFGFESKDFAVLALQQRDVEITVDAVDRGGNFIGSLSIGGKNFAVSLVANGLATVSNAERLPYGSELQNAQRAAKEAAKNIWSAADAIPARQRLREEKFARQNPESYTVAVGPDTEWTPVTVTDVVDGLSLWIQPQTEAAGAAFTEIQARVTSLAGAPPLTEAPAVGAIVAVLFKEDKSWNRGKVVAVYGADKEAEISFIDFGTRQSTRFKDLRAIPGDASFEIVKKQAPLATLVTLAYLMPLPRACEEFADAAVEAINAYCSGDLVARAEFVDGQRRKFYSLSTAVGQPTLSEVLVKDGLALVDRRVSKVDTDGTKRLLEAQEVARRAHANIWQFGDVEGDDEEDERRR